MDEGMKCPIRGQPGLDQPCMYGKCIWWMDDEDTGQGCCIPLAVAWLKTIRDEIQWQGDKGKQ